MITLMKRWLTDKDGNKLAPKTLLSQILNSDGTKFESKYEQDMAHKADLDEETGRLSESQAPLVISDQYGDVTSGISQQFGSVIIGIADRSEGLKLANVEVSPSGVRINVDEGMDIQLVAGDGCKLNGETIATIETINAENILPYPYYDFVRTGSKKYTHNSVEWDDLGDGRVVANGTASGGVSYMYCTHRTNSDYTLPAGRYTVHGCPKDGSNRKYYVWVNYTDANGTTQNAGQDYGEGLTFTLPEGVKGIGVYLAVYTNFSVDNLIFEPMIEFGGSIHKFNEYRYTKFGLRRDLDALIAMQK